MKTYKHRDSTDRHHHVARASSDAGIALMPGLMLKIGNFDLSAISLQPRQYRRIGLATLPVRETTLLVRTFIAFCRGYSF